MCATASVSSPPSTPSSAKNSTKIAKEALETGRSVYDLVIEHGILTQEDLDKVLAPENMIQPVRLDIKPLK